MTIYVNNVDLLTKSPILIHYKAETSVTLSTIRYTAL